MVADTDCIGVDSVAISTVESLIPVTIMLLSPVLSAMDVVTLTSITDAVSTTDAVCVS